MSEYWKSNDKKYCDFCKCWIADNKATIALHEQGKRHKDSVQIRLIDIKKRATEKRTEDNEYNATMDAIERAAMKTMEKDLEYNPALKKQYGLEGAEHVKQETVVKKDHESLASKKKAAEKRKLALKEKPKGPTKIGAWQPIEKKVKIEDDEPVDLQLPTQQNVKFETFKPINEEVTVRDKNVVAEKVVTLNTNPSKVSIAFKKRSVGNQQARQRTDD